MHTTSSFLRPVPGAVGPKPWGLPAIVLVLAIPTLLWAGGFFVEVAEEASRAEVLANLIVMIVVQSALFIGIPAGIVFLRHRLGWGALGFRPFDRGFWWLPPAAVGIAYVGLVVYNSLLMLLGAEAPEQEELEPFFDHALVLPLTAFTLVIMAPLSEEVLFRGFVFAGLIRSLGAPAAMAVSGFLFGVFHVSGLTTLPLLLPIGVIGAGFAWIYYRTGSLWLSIGAHAIFNLVSFLARVAVAGV